MARTLNDYRTSSKRANGGEVAEMRAVFDQAYSLARQVIELREKHGMTQEDLAEATGLTQARISKIERGVIAPTSTTLAKIGTALGVELRFIEPQAPAAG